MVNLIKLALLIIFLSTGGHLILLKKIRQKKWQVSKEINSFPLIIIGLEICFAPAMPPWMAIFFILSRFIFSIAHACRL